MKSSIIQVRKELSAPMTVHKILLICGILSSLLYIAMNVVGAMLYEGYSSVSQTVSELSALGAPTRPLWVALGVVYTLLVAAFGWGVRESAGNNRPLRIAGGLLIIYGLVGLGWPLAPMHQRDVLAAGGGTLTDTMHIVFSAVTVLLMLTAIGFGAKALGKRFRLYSMVTIIILMVFGAWTAMEGPTLEANLPTPWLGLVERILIFVFLLWVVVLAVILLRAGKRQVQLPA